MNTDYLLFSIGIATFGFIIWYTLSASIRLSKIFQIHYDINVPYVNRIYRRRILIFLLYAFIPYLLITEWNILGNVTLSDLGIHFTWNSKATFWVVLVLIASIIYNFVISGRDFNLTENPEIRVTYWTPKLFALSAFTWMMQVFAIELLYRGFLLQSLLMNGLSPVFSILISTGIYSLAYYFRQGRYAWFSIPYGILAAYIVIDTQSIWPIMIIHLCHALGNEWLSVRKHPEVRIS